MKILIVDNEVAIRNGLQKMIQDAGFHKYQIVEANGVQDGIKQFEAHLPEIVFLDVELDDGTGIELANQLIQISSFQLIFITAHNKYAMDAFKLSAIDFLLKPIDKEDLFRALFKAETNLQNLDLKNQIEILQESLKNISTENRKIVLKDADSIYFVKVSEIIRCEADGPYTIFHIGQGQKITISKSLKEYETVLEPFGFIRVHHSHIVNANKVLRFDKAEGGSVFLENQEKVPVSNRKKDKILSVLANK